MEPYFVTFAGHRTVDHFREIESNLYQIIHQPMQDHTFVEFHVGNDGEFETVATSVIRRIRKEVGTERLAINLILPYAKANMDLLSQSFDSVIIPDKLAKSHYKAAISTRNRWMVDPCNLSICHVTHSGGGAEKVLKYAQGRPIDIWNV